MNISKHSLYQVKMYFSDHQLCCQKGNLGFMCHYYDQCKRERNPANLSNLLPCFIEHVINVLFLCMVLFAFVYFCSLRSGCFSWNWIFD